MYIIYSKCFSYNNILPKGINSVLMLYNQNCSLYQQIKFGKILNKICEILLKVKADDPSNIYIYIYILMYCHKKQI